MPAVEPVYFFNLKHYTFNLSIYTFVWDLTSALQATLYDRHLMYFATSCLMCGDGTTSVKCHQGASSSCIAQWWTVKQRDKIICVYEKIPQRKGRRIWTCSIIAPVLHWSTRHPIIHPYRLLENRGQSSSRTVLNFWHWYELVPDYPWSQDQIFIFEFLSASDVRLQFISHDQRCHHNIFTVVIFNLGQLKVARMAWLSWLIVLFGNELLLFNAFSFQTLWHGGTSDQMLQTGSLFQR